jgi:hypothetical protein
MGSNTVPVSWIEMEQAIKLNPQRGVSLSGEGAASTSVAVMPTGEAKIAWLPGWTEDDSMTVGDPVSLSLWVRDPMYRAASAPIRRSMEMEESAWLLHNSETAWKEHNGRVRGWIRKHLEEDLRLRAGGGEPAPDAWETIRTTKRSALLMDYICKMRDLRVALWWPDHKSVTVLPASASSVTEVVQFNCLSGRIMMAAAPSGQYKVSGATWPLLLEKAGDITWTPAASISAAGGQTVAQIQERIASLPGGATAPKTGGRTVLWNRLHWLTLVASLNGQETEAVSAGKLE